MDRLLTATAVAKRLSVRPKQLLQWAKEGRMPPPVMLPDRIPRWWWSTIVRWVDSLSAGSKTNRYLEAKWQLETDRWTEDLPPLARAILHILRRQPSCWVTGQELAAEIGDVDRYSGTFNRAIKVLKDRGLLESHPSYGYRVKQPEMNQAT